MPARAFLECMKGHWGFYCCEGCEIRGIKENNVTEYPLIKCVERTNISFRNQTQPAHQKEVSLLLRIRPFLNMIFVVVLDSMHLFYQGVTKRLLDRWFIILGRAKVGQRLKKEVSRRLNFICKDIPCKFQRKNRSLDSLKKMESNGIQLLSFILWYGSFTKYFKCKSYEFFFAFTCCV